jgi:adenylate cyclase
MRSGEDLPGRPPRWMAATYDTGVRRLRGSRPLVRSGLVAVVVAATVTLLAAAGLAGGVFAGFQRQSLDRLFPTGRVDPRIVVVGIDAFAIRHVDQPWPWQRQEQAQLIRAIQEAEPRLVLYDVLLSPAAPGDAQLVAAMGGGDVVLSEVATFDASIDQPLYEARSVDGPSSDLAGAAAGIGQANLLADPADGVVRSIPLVIEAPDRALIPSVVLQTYSLIRGFSPVPTIRPGGVQVGAEFIPTAPRATLQVSFAQGLDQGDPNAPYVSAGDVLTGSGRQSLRGAIVVVGVVDPSTGDVHATPIGSATSGVFILANALNTLLTHGFLAPTPRILTLVWVGLLALLVALLVQVTPPWVAGLGSVALGGGYLLLVFDRFDGGHVMNLAYPELGVVAAFVGSLGERTVAEVRRRRHVSSLFAQYVPPVVARRLIGEPELVEAALRGERFEASMLFCDLRGFTALAGSLTAQQLRDMLEVFYDHASRIVLERQGTLIQYVGDEVFATFGVPAPMPDHAECAVACAVALQRVNPVINARLAEIGVPSIRYGVGIESGEVVAALVGNESRRQYGVYGDAVNVAARLCANAQAGEVWISGDVLRQLDPRPPVEDLGIVPFKNVTRPVQVYRLGLERTVDGSEESASPRPAHSPNRGPRGGAVP